jgi:hypothetical protein
VEPKLTSDFFCRDGNFVNHAGFYYLGLWACYGEFLANDEKQVFCGLEFNSDKEYRLHQGMSPAVFGKGKNRKIFGAISKTLQLAQQLAERIALSKADSETYENKYNNGLIGEDIAGVLCIIDLSPLTKRSKMFGQISYACIANDGQYPLDDASLFAGHGPGLNPIAFNRMIDRQLKVLREFSKAARLRLPKSTLSLIIEEKS